MVDQKSEDIKKVVARQRAAANRRAMAKVAAAAAKSKDA